MTRLELFAAASSDDVARLARVIEEFERHQFAIVDELCGTPYRCVVCDKPITDLNFLAFGGTVVVHQGNCSFTYDLRLTMAREGTAFDLRSWVMEDTV